MAREIVSEEEFLKEEFNVRSVANKLHSDEFPLYDLRVQVIEPRGEMVCNHQVGSYFTLSGENLAIPEGMTFPIYSIAALIPILPARQRFTHPNDWMSTDSAIACQDRNCGGLFEVRRTRIVAFGHSEVTKEPLPSEI